MLLTKAGIARPGTLGETQFMTYSSWRWRAWLTAGRKWREWLTPLNRRDHPVHSRSQELVQGCWHLAAEQVATSLPISFANGGFLCKHENQLSKSDREGSSATPTGRVDTTVGRSGRYYAHQLPTGDWWLLRRSERRFGGRRGHKDQQMARARRLGKPTIPDSPLQIQQKALLDEMR